MNEQEKKELESLERKFAKGQKDAIYALREIRERKMYKEDYGTFDNYMARRWNRTRQWATQMISWVRQQELLDEQFGNGIYQLSPAEATTLAVLEPKAKADNPDLLADLYVEAIKDAQQEAEASGKSRTVEMVKRAVAKKRNFLQNLYDFGISDLTRDESDQLDRIKDKMSYADARSMLQTAREISEKEDRYSAECLEELVDKSRKDGPSNQENRDQPEQIEEPKDHHFYEVEPYGDLSDMMTTKKARVDGSQLREILHLVQQYLEKGTFKDGGVRFRLVTTN